MFRHQSAGDGDTSFSVGGTEVEGFLDFVLRDDSVRLSEEFGVPQGSRDAFAMPRSDA